MAQEADFNTQVEEDYPDFLRDESRRAGDACSISFPRSEAEVRAHLAEARRRELKVTVQAARTGITGGAVPEGGHILNLSRMTGITGLRRRPGGEGWLVGVQPGVVLAELRAAVGSGEFDTTDWTAESVAALREFKEDRPHFFPPDPTETSAAVGGMIACNASGAQSFFYGPTRDYVQRLRVVLADGSVADLSRDRERAEGRRFALTTEGGGRYEGELPDYAPPRVKNAAGYYVEPDMDLVDLFIGAEGTLGIVVEAELLLIPAPEVRWGITVFLPDEESAIQFVERVRGQEVRPVAVEFFNHSALALLREQKESNPAFGGLPELGPERHTAIYLEYHGDDEGAVEDAVMEMTEALTACGGDEDATWLAEDDREMQRLKEFRHAVPEGVNLLIDRRRKEEPGLTKLGTDLAVPDERLREVMDLYHRGLEQSGLESVMFGHIGDNHVHVNIIPRSLEEYQQGKALYLEWARDVVRMGGTVSAEHGIGKIKVLLLREMYGDDGIRHMHRIKDLLDPDALLNPGNLFGREAESAVTV